MLRSLAVGPGGESLMLPLMPMPMGAMSSAEDRSEVAVPCMCLTG